MSLVCTGTAVRLSSSRIAFAIAAAASTSAVLSGRIGKAFRIGLLRFAKIPDPDDTASLRCRASSYIAATKSAFDSCVSLPSMTCSGIPTISRASG